MKREHLLLCLCGLSLFLFLVSASSSVRAAERVLLYRLGPTQGTLYLANADGSGEHALLPPGALDYDPAWSPKGDWIAFTSERNGSADLYRVKAPSESKEPWDYLQQVAAIPEDQMFLPPDPSECSLLR